MSQLKLAPGLAVSLLIPTTRRWLSTAGGIQPGSLGGGRGFLSETYLLSAFALVGGNHLLPYD